MTDAWLVADIISAEQELLATRAPLMRRAATALADAVHAPRGAHITVLVGSGNNGGDGLHAAAILAQRGYRVTAVLCAVQVHPGGWRAARDAGVSSVRIVPGAHLAVDDAGEVWIGEAVATAFQADVLIDALTGIGSSGGLRDDARRIVDLLAELTSQISDPQDRPLIIAVDVPSGIGVDDGTVPGPVLPADLTVTMGAAKIGLIVPPAAHLAGTVEVVDLGFADTALWPAPAVRQFSRAEVAAEWPVPGAADHKYTRGVLGVDAGSAVFPGAGVLCTMSALATGVGMVRFLGDAEVADRVLARCPEVVTVPGRVQGWVIGPGAPAEGVGRSSALERFARIIDEAQLQHLPIVVDAGALEALPSRVLASVVITPHAGELARLLAWRGHDVDRADIEAEPLLWAQRAQDITGATVLLKGSITIIVGPGTEPQSQQTFVHGQMPAWLATAGTGDVLAGVIGAALAGTYAQHRADDGVAAAVARAVAVYGHAASLASAGGPFTTRDLVHSLPAAVRDVLNPEL